MTRIGIILICILCYYQFKNLFYSSINRTDRLIPLHTSLDVLVHFLLTHTLTHTHTPYVEIQINHTQNLRTLSQIQFLDIIRDIMRRIGV